MRTTLTLDDDVAARLQAEARRTGRPFRTVVNETLRTAFAQSLSVPEPKPFKVQSRSMGGPLPGGSYDDVEGLLELLEGPRHR